MSKREMRCPHKPKISDCSECMAELNAIGAPEQFLREFVYGWLVEVARGVYDHEDLPKLADEMLEEFAKLLQLREQAALETFIFKQLNERQVAIYKYAQANGGVIECSLRELGSHVGMRNPQLVKHHLVALVDMGLLESTSGVQLNKGATRTYRIAQLTTPNKMRRSNGNDF